MMVECINCGAQIDPNADDAPWVPPLDPSKSAGALKCPECDVTKDWIDWKVVTNRDVRAG